MGLQEAKDDVGAGTQTDCTNTEGNGKASGNLMAPSLATDTEPCRKEMRWNLRSFKAPKVPRLPTSRNQATEEEVRHGAAGRSALLPAIFYLESSGSDQNLSDAAKRCLESGSQFLLSWASVALFLDELSTKLFSIKNSGEIMAPRPAPGDANGMNERIGALP